MQIGLIGATGGSGRAFLSLALDAGYRVNVVARRPEAVESPDRKGLTISKGDATDAAALARGLSDCHTVVNLVGISGLLMPARAPTCTAKASPLSSKRRSQLPSNGLLW